MFILNPSKMRLTHHAWKETLASKHINVVCHYDDEILIDKSGKLIAIIQLKGIDAVTQPDEWLDRYKHRRNHWFKSFTSDYALYTWRIRRKTSPLLEGAFSNAYANKVNQKYQQKIQQTELFENTLYMALITKQPEGILNRGLSTIKQLSHRLDKDEKQKYLQQRKKDLKEQLQTLMGTLADYEPKLLGVYEKNGIKFSEPLEFLTALLNFAAHPVPLTIADASKYLLCKRPFFNARSGTIELRAADNSKKFAAVLSIKEYVPWTHQGIFDDLNHLRIEYTLTQSYRFYDRQVAKTKLRDQQSDLAQSKDESESQTQQIDEAFDDAASGETGYGKHHLTLICYADSQESLNKAVGVIVAKFSDKNIVCVREDVVCECGFWAQLPGNFSYIARSADISTKNLAGFISLHNAACGKKIGNHWGEAVTIFETLSGSPYYFNFHYRDVGNFLVFGSMGSGKTVLIGFLLLQSMKFGGKRIIFDKDRGLEIIIRAMGGIYQTIKPGLPTQFNPCQLADTSENRNFLSALFKKMLTVSGPPLTEMDLTTINQAIQGLYELAKPERQLCHIASFFGARKNGSLRMRFDQWHSDGPHAWLFDNPTDSLCFNPDVMGFDLGHLLKEETCKIPGAMYLMHCTSQAIENERAILFCDEGWNLLDDDYFKRVMNDWSRTPRKKNNVLGLATQAAEDTVLSDVSKTLNDSAVCRIFFPNSNANYRIYTEEFGLSDYEFHLIKTLPDDQHYFLLNFGRGKESTVLRLNLSGLEDEIAVISAREHTCNLLDRLRLEVGDDPINWLPLFHARRREVHEK